MIGLIASSPDITFQCSNMIIRNRLDGCIIMADFEINGTPTFHMLVKNILKSALTAKSEISDGVVEKKKRKRDSVIIIIIIIKHILIIYKCKIKNYYYLLLLLLLLLRLLKRLRFLIFHLPWKN